MRINSWRRHDSNRNCYSNRKTSAVPYVSCSASLKETRLGAGTNCLQFIQAMDDLPWNHWLSQPFATPFGIPPAVHSVAFVDPFPFASIATSPAGTVQRDLAAMGCPSGLLWELITSCDDGARPGHEENHVFFCNALLVLMLSKFYTCCFTSIYLTNKSIETCGRNHVDPQSPARSKRGSISSGSNHLTRRPVLG